jgi:hypothetical protein
MSDAPSVSKTEERAVKLGLKANWQQSPHAGERIGWRHVWGGCSRSGHRMNLHSHLCLAQ